MFSNRHPNKYQSVVQQPQGYTPVKPTLAILWGVTIGLSFYFMDDIYLFSIDLEQQASKREQQLGQQISSLIKGNPQLLTISELKNQWTAPIEDFYDREMRFGTKHLSTTKPVQKTTPEQTIVSDKKISKTIEKMVAKNTKSDSSITIKSEEVTKKNTLPRKVLLLGGSSMKTALGALLQSKFREHGVETIREAQVGTGLARADVVDWVSKAENIFTVHKDIDLVVVQFIGNDCQTLVDANHNIEARFGDTNWTSTYLDRWNRLLAIAQKYNTQLVIIGLPIMKSKRFDNTIQSVSRTVFDWADTHGVPVVEIRDQTTSSEGDYQQYQKEDGKTIKIRHKDGIHLSYQGAKRISQHIFLHLEELFKWTTTP